MHARLFLHPECALSLKWLRLFINFILNAFATDKFLRFFYFLQLVLMQEMETWDLTEKLIYSKFNDFLNFTA
jgi:hypothetical protein